MTFVDYVPQNPPASKKEEAKRFILHALKLDGPLSYEEIVMLAEDEGFSEGTLRKARTNLIKSGQIRQTGGSKHATWELSSPRESMTEP